MAKKIDLDLSCSCSFADLSYYADCLTTVKKLMQMYSGSSVLGDLARCSKKELEACGMQGVMSQTAIKAELDKKDEDTRELPTDDQLKKIETKENPLISVKNPDFKALEYDPFGDPPRIASLFREKDGKLELVTRESDPDAYAKYLQQCQAAYTAQSIMLGKMIKEQGIEIIGTLSPRVIATQRETIGEALRLRHEVKNKEFETRRTVCEKGWDKEVTNLEDGTEKTVHYKGIEEYKADHGAAKREYERLKSLLIISTNTPEQRAQIRDAMKKQLEAQKEAVAGLRACNEDLAKIAEEEKDEQQTQSRENRSVKKQLDRRAVKKAEKQLKGETKERISLRQKIEDAKMGIASRAEEITMEKDGNVLRPVVLVKAVKEEVFSAISSKLRSIVDPAKARAKERAEARAKERAEAKAAKAQVNDSKEEIVEEQDKGGDVSEWLPEQKQPQEEQEPVQEQPQNGQEAASEVVLEKTKDPTVQPEGFVAPKTEEEFEKFFAEAKAEFGSGQSGTQEEGQ